jgi:hypothetical protein
MWRELTTIDRWLVAGILGCLIWPAFPSWMGLSPHAELLWIAPYIIALCTLMVAWMKKGGAKSQLWKWMPPLMPWGWILKADTSRWAFVVIFASVGVASTIHLAMLAFAA